ncbi:MAG: GNAT family N-acetyltransferase [Candidatus Thermoplasmatota archaeon]|nr:GNAT family N-acetyltransferase [Candidatus Thermoplasmatota archaeon]MCK5300327.1 GNAT family N-acetyltransferase [Thermoplasmatales archaeon]
MFTVRKFSTNDMFSVIRLSSENLTERYNPNLFNYFYETFPKGFWVCEIHHKIVGFLVGIKLSHEIAKILMLSVSNTYQNQGIGSKLLLSFLREITLQNIKKVELEVSTKNYNAIKFYKKYGFEIVDIIKTFYENKDDAFIMKLVL